MKLKTAFLTFSILGFAVMASAQELPQDSISSVLSSYRSYKDVSAISIRVPTVVELPFSDEFIERFDFAILDRTTNAFEPYTFKQETLINEIPVSLSTDPYTSTANRMLDNDVRSYADFPLPNEGTGQIQITLSNTKPITSSALTILLDKNVAMPNFIEIRAVVNGQNRIVVSNTRINQSTIRFPQTTSSSWTITFIFGQPLRISELRLHQDNANRTSTRSIRFLAQPTHSYRVYFDPDRATAPPVGEAGNLAFAKEALKVFADTSQSNPNYIIADVDADGVPDVRDNCVSLANADQQDMNNNGRGDMCDDFDQDGVMNSKDNCLNNPNRDQGDTDSDGIGNVCDAEESRITERYTWVPWVGIGFAVLVLIVLLVLMARSTRVPEQNVGQ